MPQINDTTGSLKTSFLVRVDAKAEAWERVSIPRGTVDIIEGGLMKRDASGRAAKPAPAPADTVLETFVFINYTNPNAGSVNDRQPVNDVGGTTFVAAVEGGGYAGVQGDGLKVGMPLTEQYFVKADLAALATPGTRIVLKRETDAAAARFNDIKFGAASGAAGALLGAATVNEGALCYAVSQWNDNSVLWMLFGNRGVKN